MGNFSATHLIIFLALLGLLLFFFGGYLPYPFFYLICAVAAIVVILWAIRAFGGTGPLP